MPGMTRVKDMSKHSYHKSIIHITVICKNILNTVRTAVTLTLLSGDSNTEFREKKRLVSESKYIYHSTQIVHTQ